MPSTPTSIQALSDSAFALADCMVSLLDEAKSKADRADVLMALGSCLTLCVAMSPDDQHLEAAECHDVALKEVATLFGIRLRELHPPRARHGLFDSAEFAGHFADSYVPLIQRALQNGQKVLSFRGWPTELGATWGIVLRGEHSGEQLLGQVPDNKNAIPLTQPALQCYVVENVEPAQPTAEAILISGAVAVIRLQKDGTKVFPDLMSASQALSGFAERLNDNEPQGCLNALCDLARLLGERRQIAVGFLESNAPGFRPEIAKHAETLLRLSQFDRKEATNLSDCLSGDHGYPIDAIRDGIEKLMDHDSEISKCVDAIANLA